MSRLRDRDLGDFTHSGRENHGQEFDVILVMDWMTSYRVVIDCESRRVTAYTQDGTRVVFQGDKHNILPRQYTSLGVRDNWRVG